MQTTLITGASSGIGESLAGHFAAGGSNLILVARTEAKLKTLAKQLQREHSVQVWVLPADLSKRGAAKKLAASLKAQSIEFDVLVNCAGILEHGFFVDNGAAAHQQIIDLNITGLTSMLDVFLPGMVKRGGGRVLNVASIASFQPLPSLAVYAASKAYVLSLTESLAEELKGTGVTITALCPGVTATNMLSSAQQKSEGLNLPGFIIGDVEDVAEQGYQACMKGEVICVPGAINLAATVAGRATPKWLLRRVSGLVGRYTAGKG
ncbi:SDR family oxidoreductase [Halieaceae bacterium IMCC14734]|uniref:SDR family oxidoreductase n=1 Tax=Candidatus Litorirhabdus singularis TaxID=2518993 RepID=A0ABT3TNK5_9GAMM|nr:SDR family oxidoreductase [Candidatus Litorirhabdus singularis]MCX2982892.1 SDR family oxidoreductase [Candidatus Litorirhabdus singularis]